MTKYSPELAKKLLERILTNSTPAINLQTVERIEADIYTLENLEPPKNDNKLYNTTIMTAKNLRILLSILIENRKQFTTAINRMESSTPPPKVKSEKQNPNATQALDIYEKELFEHDKFIKKATKPYEKSYQALLELFRKEIFNLIKKL
jgi:hypothetical protein